MRIRTARRLSVAVLLASILATAAPTAAQESVDLADAVLPPELAWQATKLQTLINPPYDIPSPPDGVTIDGTLVVVTDCSGIVCSSSSAIDIWPQTPFGDLPDVPWIQDGATWTLDGFAFFVSSSYPDGTTCVYRQEEHWDVEVIDAVFDGEALVATELVGTFERGAVLDPAASTIGPTGCLPYEDRDLWSMVATANVVAVASTPATTAPPITQVEVQIETVTSGNAAPTSADLDLRPLLLVALILLLVAGGGLLLLVKTQTKRRGEEEPPVIITPDGDEQEGAYCDWTVVYVENGTERILREPRGHGCCRYVIAVQTTQMLLSIKEESARYFGPAPMRIQKYGDEPYWVYDRMGRYWVNEVSGTARVDMDGLGLRANAIAQEREGVPTGDVTLPRDSDGFPPTNLYDEDIEALGRQLGLSHPGPHARFEAEAKAGAEIRFVDATRVTITRSTHAPSTTTRQSSRAGREPCGASSTTVAQITTRETPA